MKNEKKKKKKMILFSGTVCKDLSKNISQILEIELGMLKVKKYPDGETYVRILSDNIKGEECAVVQSVNSNDALVELLFILDCLNDLGAGKVHAIIPYLGYARQDKRFLSGEAITSKIVLNLIKERCDEITTVNAHFFDSGGKQTFEGIRINNLNAFPLLGDYFRDKLEKPVLVAPDEGALGYVEEASKLLGIECDHCKKLRLSDDEVKISYKDLKIERQDAIFLDDIISTGVTLIEATKKIYSECGARSVNIGVVHGVLVEGLRKVTKVADDIICTNSIYRKEFSKVSLAPLIAEFLKKKE